MQAQGLFASIEGCTVEPVQSELALADRTDDARSAASAGGLKLVLSARNCPEDRSGPDFLSIAERLEADGHRHIAAAVRRIGPIHFPH